MYIGKKELNDCLTSQLSVSLTSIIIISISMYVHMYSFAYLIYT